MKYVYTVYANFAWMASIFFNLSDFFYGIREKQQQRGTKMANWSTAEIEKLRIGYREGASLKVIARLVDRSPTAVSKALTRLGIRPLGFRPPGIRPGIPASGTLTCQQLERIINQELTSNKDLYSDSLEQKDKSTPPLFSNKNKKKLPEPGTFGWVPMESVLHYLESQGYEIIRCKKEKDTPYKMHDYLVNHKPYHAPQVLMIANRLRFLRGLEPYLVENITA